jgi:hypothetical protein
MRLCPIKQVGPMGSVAVVTLLMIASIQPARAGMCACCVDPGERYERTGKLYDFEFEIINNLKLYAVARLYSTDAFPHGFKGMSAADESTLAKDYRLRASQNGRKWTLNFTRNDGKRGALIFTLPTTATQFGADLNTDLRKEPQDPGHIYKEVRLKGTVVGTGMFAAGNSVGTRFVLTLQGYGNRCMSESDFRSWTLAVSGPRASYRFYGATIAPA